MACPAYPRAVGQRSPGGTAATLSNDESAAESLAARIERGALYAKAACQQCHLFPDPSLLDRKSWQNSVLPKMMLYLGLSTLDQVKVQEPELVKASGILPLGPRIPRDYWAPIVAYYLHNAPEQALPQDPKVPVTTELKQFRVDPPKFRRDPPLTTLVKIDEAERRIYVADAQAQTLDILNSDGAVQQSVEVGNIPVALQKTERGLYLTCIGHFFPSEKKQGQIILLEKSRAGYQRKVILGDLPRVSDLKFGDFNGDGKTDFVLSMFGYLSGRLSWFENLDHDQYREHVLIPKAGAMQTWVRDFNGDGTSDIMALFGQENDGVLMLSNDPKNPGTFDTHELIRKPPAFGPDYFELADFNKDGLMDLLLVNGDGADFVQPPKKYHGVRIYLNRGQNRFEEAYFFPLNGAFKAVARDFDNDGDLDIAAISFFPDYASRPMESFVYLENQGDMKFTAATFPQCLSGRWLTMDAGDVDGDGDLDLVLGSLVNMPGSPVPERLQTLWNTRGPSVLVLKNTLHP